MKQPIMYSFVRFRPYFETGEFVNIGILMCEPELRRLSYRLVPKNNKRVNQFFYNSHIFEEMRDIVNEQLRYIIEQEFTFNTAEMARFFHHYIDIKEGGIQYSDAIVGLVDDPKNYLDDLYHKFICLGGVKNENQELTMIKYFRDVFRKENNALLTQYKQHLIKGDTARFSLPLAIKDEISKRVIKGIKPLAFDQTESAGMIEHCDNWIAKINRASDEGLILKNDILFTLDTAKTQSEIKILDTIRDSFSRYNIHYIDWKEIDGILSFAKDVATFPTLIK